MRLKFLTIVAFLAVPLAGCVKVGANSYCDIATPLYFDSMKISEWLIEHDRKLLTDIVINNETHANLC
jgi:hypothetical protein